MGSLSASGAPVSQDKLQTKHHGHCVVVNNYITDMRQDCFANESMVPGTIPTTGVLPTTVSGLILWLDGSDASTLTTSGIFIEEWANKAPVGIPSVVAITGAVGGGFTVAKPTVTTLNGHGAVAFSSFPDITPLEGGPVFGAASYTIFAVANKPSAAGGGSILASSRPQIGPTGQLYLFDGAIRMDNAAFGQDITWRAGQATTETGNNLALYNPGETVIITASEINDSTRSIRVNGSLRDENFIPIGPLPPGYMVGDGIDSFVIGSRKANTGTPPPTYNSPFEGILPEVLVYNKTLLPTEVASLEAYLAYKWGVTI